MSKVTFTFVKNEQDYYNSVKYKFDFIFADKKYSSDCVVLKDLNLFNCIVELCKSEYNFYCYINSKCSIRNNYLDLIENKNLYLNYFNNNIYYLKYDKLLNYFINLFLKDLKDEIFFSFINNYFFSYEYFINKDLGGKIVFPKNKFIYNSFNEKFKNKKHQS